MDENTIPSIESDGTAMRTKFREMNQRLAHYQKELAEKDAMGATIDSCLRKIAELQAQSQWVPVSEKLPKRGGGRTSKAVLIWCPENQCQFTATYCPELEEWEHFPRGAVMWPVTRWMHLPADPQEKTDG